MRVLIIGPAAKLSWGACTKKELSGLEAVVAGFARIQTPRIGITECAKSVELLDHVTETIVTDFGSDRGTLAGRLPPGQH
jgi:hypothetical protein